MRTVVLGVIVIGSTALTSGSSAGAGGTSPAERPAAASGLSIGMPNVQGDLDKTIVRRSIQRNRQKLQACYDKALAKKQDVTGTVMAEYTIGTDGHVKSAKVTGRRRSLPELETCIAGVIKAIEFPRPNGKSDVPVTEPFTFHPPAADSH